MKFKTLKFIINFIFLITLYIVLGSLFSFAVNYVSPSPYINKYKSLIFIEIILEFSLTGLIIYYVSNVSRRFWVPFEMTKEVENTINNIAQTFFMITIFLFQEDLIEKLAIMMNVEGIKRKN